MWHATTVLNPIWVIAFTTWLLLFRTVSDVASASMALLNLSLDVTLTLLRPIWRIYALMSSTDRLYLRAIVAFQIPFTFYDSRAHQSSTAEVTSDECTTRGELGLPQKLAVRMATWVVDEADGCVIAHAIAHLG